MRPFRKATPLLGIFQTHLFDPKAHHGAPHRSEHRLPLVPIRGALLLRLGTDDLAIRARFHHRRRELVLAGLDGEDLRFRPSEEHLSQGRRTSEIGSFRCLEDRREALHVRHRDVLVHGAQRLRLRALIKSSTQGPEAPGACTQAQGQAVQGILRFGSISYRFTTASEIKMTPFFIDMIYVNYTAILKILHM